MKVTEGWNEIEGCSVGKERVRMSREGRDRKRERKNYRVLDCARKDDREREARVGHENLPASQPPEI